MKRLKFIVGSLIAALVSFSTISCNDDDGYSLGDIYYSLATVNPIDDGEYYDFTLDNGVKLWIAATHIHNYAPKSNQRALIYYTILSDEVGEYDHSILLRGIRNILTKNIAENLGADNDATYGTNKVKIYDMWIGDGYLNVEFGFNFGGNAVHYINLVETDDENVFEFRHNAYNDTEVVGRRGLVAFRLSPFDNTEDEITLTIKVNTFDGDKDFTVKYNPKQVSGNAPRQFNLEDISNENIN